MPFDPDAYLAQKAAPPASGFDPDAYLKSKTDVTPPKPDVKPPVKAPVGGIIGNHPGVGAGEAALAMGSGLIAKPLSDIAGLAATAKELISPNGGDPEGFRRHVQESLTYAPRTNAGQNIMRVPQAIGEIGNKITAPIMSGLRGDASADSPRGMAVNALGEGVSQGLGMAGVKGVPKVPGVVRGAAELPSVRTLRGVDAKAATGEAQTAARSALNDASKARGAEHAAASGEANTLADLQTRLQRDLDAQAARNGRPTLDQQGTTLRSTFQGVMEAAANERSSVTKPLYQKAEEAADARERDGARINVTPAIKDIEALAAEAENIPELKSKLETLLGAVKGRPQPPGPPGIVDMHGKPFHQPAQDGLTYRQLDLANRYIKDFAYRAELEGFKSTVGMAARNLAAKLDKQITEFVPEHAAATAKYREMSEPMESLATRLGKAMTGTEGGIANEAYAKVAAQDLPNRVFAKADGRALLVDALAGGKKATAEMRAKAQRQVDTMVENWIMERARGTQARVGAEAAAQVPVPGIAPRAEAQFAREAANQTRIAEAKAGEGAARGTAEIAAKAKQKVDGALAQADVDFQYGSKQKAYDGYVAALRQAMVGSDPAKYKAAIELIERAGTLQAKTDKARELAKKFISGAALVGAGYEAKGLLQ